MELKKMAKWKAAASYFQLVISNKLGVDQGFRWKKNIQKKDGIEEYNQMPLSIESGRHWG